MLKSNFIEPLEYLKIKCGVGGKDEGPNLCYNIIILLMIIVSLLQEKAAKSDKSVCLRHVKSS